MARFDFEGEHSDELSFSEGDVIQLKEYVGQDWARGQIGGHTGIFPLNFVDVIEDLPPPPSQKPSKKVALPGKIFWCSLCADFKTVHTYIYLCEYPHYNIQKFCIFHWRAFIKRLYFILAGTYPLWHVKNLHLFDFN